MLRHRFDFFLSIVSKSSFAAGLLCFRDRCKYVACFDMTVERGDKGQTKRHELPFIPRIVVDLAYMQSLNHKANDIHDYIFVR